jgi:hypothetical protein
MTRDEARKLVGGYATGSLTEAERSALFEAALEDQELFDELAGEQVLKEVLDEPEARQRLLNALEPPPHRAAWWIRPWPWAAAAATLAVAIGIVVYDRTPPRQGPPQQIAQVAVNAPEPAPPAPAPAPVPKLPPPPALRKVSPPAPPLPKPSEEARQVAAQEQLTDKLQTDAIARGGTVARGFTAAAPAVAALRAEKSAANALSGFAFSYTVGADGFLEIVPAEPAFLSVTANDVVIFPSAAVAATTPVRIQIPSAASSLVIVFSRTPGVTGSPVRRDATAVRETDQDPPNGRIIIELFLTPATR